MSIAQTILQQLGGNKFIAMTGAKNFLNTGEGLTFQIPLKNNINKVNITLDVNDTYRVTFSKFSMKKLTNLIVYTVSNVYADQLQTIFTEQTGLETHL
jgi:hypothetical protein